MYRGLIDGENSFSITEEGSGLNFLFTFLTPRSFPFCAFMSALRVGFSRVDFPQVIPGTYSNTDVHFTESSTMIRCAR